MDFDFVDSGTGPALLFLPGSYSSHSAWRGVQKALQGSYRTILTSLPGYGGTPDLRAGDDGDLGLTTDFVTEVVDKVGEPVHLVGHSYGGFCVYATALSRKVKPLSIVTFEANPVYCRRGGVPFSWASEMQDMTDRFRASIAAGDPESAGIIIDFWSRPGNFQSMPESFRALCRIKAATNLLDWEAATGFAADFADFDCLDMLCTVARGELANKAIIDVSDQIVANARNAKLHVEPGADHFLISTHPAECAAVIDRHMQDFAAANPR
nr:alpha/beta hydrolase [Mesorhizobium sp.]